MRQRAQTLYKKNQVQGASPPQLILMLYRGAIRFLVVGGEGLKLKRNFAETSHHILKAMSILAELMGSLNPEPSRELADRLLNLYSYMIERLGVALKERDPLPIEEVVRLLQELEGAWLEAERKWAEEKPRQTPALPAKIAL